MRSDSTRAADAAFGVSLVALIVMVGAAVTGTTLVDGWANDAAGPFPSAVTTLILGGAAVSVAAGLLALALAGRGRK